jgi:glycosyltransferase involved in cell wall biosynthesis
MPYAIHELELNRPLEPLQLAPDETGVALIVREADDPVGFILHRTPPGALLTPDELAPLIVREAGVNIIARRARLELERSPATGPVPAVTVAICTKDRPDLVERCLTSLGRLRRPPEAPPLDILVVDNAPGDDRTRAVVERVGGARYAVEPCVGLDFARNRALREARGELVAYLDDDVVVDRGWWLGLAAAARANPDAGAYTGLVLPYELRTTAQILFEARGGFRRGFLPLRYRGQTRPGHPTYPAGAGIFGAGCNMVFRRDLLGSLGGFDEALDTGRPLPGGGDLDAFYRVIRSGATLAYEPRMLVFHQHRTELAQLRRQYWTWGLGLFAFLHKLYRTDPERRPEARHLARWWLGDLLRQVRQSLVRRHPLTVDMLLAELAGGIVALTGTYPRSVRRARRIRKACAT